MSTVVTSAAHSGDIAVSSKAEEQIRWAQYRILLGGILALGIVDVVWLSVGDLRLDFLPALFRLGIPAAMLVGAAVYGLTGRSERICATLLAVGTLLMFTLFGVILGYLAIRSGRPFIDDSLSLWDRTLGLDWPAYEGFFSTHPWLAFATGVLYQTSVPQILLVSLVLGFSGRFAGLAEFTAGLVIGAFIAVVVGAVFPALGAYHHYGLPDDGAAFFVPAIIAAHDGTLQVLDVAHATGLVVFPSFHTAISVAVIMACWRLRYLRYPALALNVVLIAGVPVWGSHYFVDLIGGTLVIVTVVLAWRSLWSRYGL